MKDKYVTIRPTVALSPLGTRLIVTLAISLVPLITGIVIGAYASSMVDCGHVDDEVSMDEIYDEWEFRVISVEQWIIVPE